MQTHNKVLLGIFLSLSILGTIGGIKKMQRPGKDYGFVAIHHHELAVNRDLRAAGMSFKIATCLLLVSAVVIGSEIRRKRVIVA